MAGCLARVRRRCAGRYWTSRCQYIACQLFYDLIDRSRAGFALQRGTKDVEDGIGTDDIEFNRYWSFSNQLPARHKPCVDSMLKVVRSHGIFTIGRILDHKVLEGFESGQLFAPKAGLCIKSNWYPEDLLEEQSELN